MSGSDLSWSPAPATMAPSADRVHVFRALLDRADSDLESLRAVLSPEEARRAARFVHPRLERRFVAGRGVLRSILAGHLGRDPADLAFSTGPFGKPRLEAAPVPLRFNASHSDGMLLVAVILDREIGIDLEQARPNVDCEAIARRFFSAREAGELLGLPEAERTAAFFRCWTRKEAFLKARGDGLQRPLSEFDVSLLPGEPPALLRTAWDPAEAGRWTLASLDPDPGFAAALCLAGGRLSIATFAWP